MTANVVLIPETYKKDQSSTKYRLLRAAAWMSMHMLEKTVAFCWMKC